MEVLKFNRHNLYLQVWAEPMTSLSRKFGISDYDLRKVCKKLEVPLPRAGHWQKIRAGKKVAPSPLPGTYSGEEQISLHQIIQPKLAEVEKLAPLVILQREIEQDLKQILHVPARLVNPDKLIVAVKEDIEQKSRTYRSTGLLNSSFGFMDIRVSRKNLGRALRFMDTFIKSLYARGHKFDVNNNGTIIQVGKETFEVSLREKLKRSKEIKPGEYNYDYTPTDVLIFKIGRYWNLKEWQDGSMPLKKKLSAIIAHLELVARKEEEKKIIREKENAIHLEKERIQIENDALKANELLKFKKLLKEAKRWRKVQKLREYIADVDRQNKIYSSPPEELKDWLEWAHKKADWYDPKINLYDELLNEVDKEKLTFKK